MYFVAIILGLVVGIGVMVVLYKPIFGDWEGFTEALGYTFKPDIWSWFNGELFEDFWNTFKFNIWWGSGLISGLVTFWLLLLLA
jgi:hypothetical protein|tara:strand:- start:341 stop:592 length:252 start_codon:yes stop_codon:yes gene_type:complete